uniref:Uncharacterized protein n=1 Tax=Oryza sativa subsp. japonica TaxID=39947 RepID=Q6EQX8_ORYSJ|nr:hypothetical protein [Oryza sativa Japonica Group]BAD28942.1 hypothetical protein [Oryza sativa Japonica Group]
MRRGNGGATAPSGPSGGEPSDDGARHRAAWQRGGGRAERWWDGQIWPDLASGSDGDGRHEDDKLDGGGDDGAISPPTSGARRGRRFSARERGQPWPASFSSSSPSASSFGCAELSSLPLSLPW